MAESKHNEAKQFMKSDLHIPYIFTTIILQDIFHNITESWLDEDFVRFLVEP